MMYEDKLLTAMVNAEQRGAYGVACSYAASLAIFMKIDTSKLPKLPMIIQTTSQQLEAYMKHYFNLLDLIAKTAADIIAEVRKKYNPKYKSDLLS